MARAYYNEFDPAAAHILRALIADGVVAPGDVDTRSIKEVMPDDLDGYTQCHFFAGGGLWSVAARLAGWPDERPLWTGSCPCQPFSAAGKGLGTDDPRHLWPDFHRLIRARRPAVVMGEQVAGAPGYGWFDGVRSDLEGEGYASRAVDFPACSVDAPHQRNRLYWIAVEKPDRGRCEGRVLLGPAESNSAHEQRPHGQSRGSGRGERGPLDHGVGTGLEGYTRHGDGIGRPEQGRPVAPADGAGTAGVGLLADDARIRPQGSAVPGQQNDTEAGGLLPAGPDRAHSLYANASSTGRDASAQAGVHSQAQGERARHVEPQRSARPIGRNGTYWSDAEWLICHDGKARRAQPGIRLLVDGLPGRVDLWRVGGNAIVPEAAKEVIAAFLDCEAAA